MDRFKGYIASNSGYFGRFFSGIKYVYNDINPATLTGAIDVIIVEQEDGSYTCGPFHVRFGKMGVIRPADKVVDIYLNGKLIEDLHMKLGSAGEAFFVEEVDEDDENFEIDQRLSVSPIPTFQNSQEESYEFSSNPDNILARTRSLETLESSAVQSKSIRRKRRRARSANITEHESQMMDDSDSEDELIGYVPDDSMLELTRCMSDELIYESMLENKIGDSNSNQRLSAYKSDSALDEQKLIQENMNITWDWGNLPESHDSFGKSIAGYSLDDSSVKVPTESDDSHLSLSPDSSKVHKDPSEEGIYLEDLVTEKVDENVKSTYIYTHSHQAYHVRKPASLDGCSSDAGYRSDGEYPTCHTPPYPVVNELKLSLCGSLNAEEKLSSELFNMHLVSYEEFLKEPAGILNNPKLVLLLNGSFYTWSVAAPMIISMLSFQTQLPHQAVQRLQDQYMPKKKTKSRRSTWFSWGSSRQPNDNRESTGTEADVNVNNDKEKPEIVAGNTPTTEPVVVQLPEATTSSRKVYRKKIRLNSEEIRRLNLKSGGNKVEYRMTTKYQGTTCCEAYIYLWRWTDLIVVSDIDGTITRSDVLGQVMPMFGKDWTQDGVARLYRNIEANGYRFVYLSARAIGQSAVTRRFIHQMVQDGNINLPDGPVLLSPNSLIHAFHREVIEKKPEIFKIQCLKDIRTLFPANTHPLYAGLGNKPNDAVAYKAVDIEHQRIFTINPEGTIRSEVSKTYSTSYRQLNELVDMFFPFNGKQVVRADNAPYNDPTYWRIPIPDLPSSFPQ